MRKLYFAISFIYFFCFFQEVNSKTNDKPDPAEYKRKIEASPLLFTENVGQVASITGNSRPDILFTAHKGNADVFLTAGSINYRFTKLTYPKGFIDDERHVKNHEQQEALRKLIKTETHQFSLSLIGANASPKIRKEEQSPFTENFYLAQCPNGITGVHNYERIVMEDVYPGIDWVIYSNGNGLKYDFVVKPGADPSQIKLKVNNASSCRLNDKGELVMVTTLGTVTEKAPVSFVDKKQINTSFAALGEGVFGFDIATWDKTKTLTIDPSVTWATYYGGAGNDWVYSCVVDASGNVYASGVAGSTSVSGISTAGAHQFSGNGSGDALLVKFNSSGVRQWATYYGGSQPEYGFACVVDGSGNPYLGGISASTSAIASGGFQTTFGGGIYDAFLVKFNSSGVRTWSTYYGGTGPDYCNALAVDASNNVYMGGESYSSSAIATGAGVAQLIFGGTADAYVAKFNSAGARQWGTYLGSTAYDQINALAIDPTGFIYAAGFSDSTFAISTAGTQQPVSGGGRDAFLVKYNTATGAKVWGTFYGGTNEEMAWGCSVDASSNVYLSGQTKSTTNIASGGFQNAFGGGVDEDAFLAKFNSSGIRQWGTYYGSTGADVGEECHADAAGNVYMVGTTSSTTGITAGGVQDVYAGDDDAFLVKFSGNGSRIWATYYGGDSTEVGYSCAVDGLNDVYIAGRTFSSSSIATAGSHQSAFAGNSDAFIAKLNKYQGPGNVNNGIQLWLDAGDINNTSPTPNPANNTPVTTWKDISGNANDATILVGQNTPVISSSQINSKDVVKFTRSSNVLGTVFEVPNVDIRGSVMPQMTVFTVYRQGAKSGNEWHGIWGDDNLNWDRFFISTFGTALPSPDDGIVSVGLPTAYVQIPGSGFSGTTKLLTAVYDHGVTNGSTIYFNALPVQTVTDNTDLTDAKTDLRIGWDGDDNPFNGDIAEMIVYNRKLTDCEIKAVNRYLGYKYGVSLSTATITPSPEGYFCTGGSVTLTASAGTSYQWLLNGSPIGAAVGATYSANAAGNYQVIVTAGGCADTSTITVVKPVPSTIFVDGGAGASGTGASWASPLKTVSEALNMANGVSCAVNIWVKAGTYYPMAGSSMATSPDSSFRILRNNIKIYGGFAGTETLLSQRNVTANITTLSGDIGVPNDSTDNCYHVMTIVGNATNNIDSNTVVDGFTITRGNAINTGGITINGMFVYRGAGGGINTAGLGAGCKSSPLLENLTFTRNKAEWGGGLYGQGHTSGTSSPVVRSCTFTSNTALSSGGGFHFYSDGAGGNVSPSFTSCIFRGNRGIFQGGAGITTGSTPAVSNPVIRLCTVDSNYDDPINTGAYYGGGFVFFGSTSNPIVSRCTFTKNLSTYGGAITSPGVVQSITVDSCSFTGNRGIATGGAIVAQNLAITVTNSTFTSNFAPSGGGISALGGTLLSVSNCDFVTDSVSFYGSAISNSTALTTTINNTRFINNYGAVVGAIDNPGGGVMNISKSIFSGNKAGEIGGVMNNFSGTANFTNCVFTGNSTVTTANAGGGVVHTTNGTTTNFNNCTLNNNTTASTAAPNGNALSVDAGSTVTFNNSIVWGSAANQIANSGTVNYNFSDIKGVAPSGSNLNIDPQFFNAANPIGADNIWATGDDGLQVSSCSPVVNAGSNALAASITNSVTGGPRIIGTSVDMGAYESSGTASPNVFVDGSVATSGSGTSWASPYKTVTEALNFVNASSCINEIWVKAGTYYPMAGAVVAANRDSSFRILRNSVRLYGGFNGTETATSQRNIAANPTILSGDIGVLNDSTDNVYHVVTITTASGTFDTTTRIDGFIVTKGNGANATGSFVANGFGFNHQDGAAIYLGAGANGTCSPIIANCTLTTNGANFGGAMYCNSFTAATAKVDPIIMNCTFTLNRAISNGGAIFLQSLGGQQRPQFIGSTFSFNSSVSNGGGIYSNFDTATYTNCTFISNTTPASGGAIFGAGDKMTFSNCTFTANSAVSSGGGIAGSNDTMKFTACTFTNNITSGSALTDGGAISSFSNSNLYITDCNFNGNSAPGNRGGAVGATGTSSIVHSTFTNNFSFAGGAVSNVGNGKLMNITNSTFTNNSSTTSGGAIISQFGSSLNVTGCMFNGNLSVSGNGGVMYSQNNGLITMVNDTLLNNRCAGSGGGLMFNGNPCVVTNSLFKGNNSATNGGGLYIGGTASVTGSVFQQDTASSGAGIFIVNSTNAYCTGNFFQSNVAAAFGGGLYSNTATDTIVNNVFVDNSAASGGGAINYGTGAASVSLIANNTIYRNSSPASSAGTRIVGTGGSLGFYNNLYWLNSSLITPDILDGSTGVTLSQGNNYTTLDPLFANASSPIGVDNIWGTADDGLQLSPCSRAIAFGANPPIANFPTDAINATRIQQTTVDAGAYESAFVNTIVTPSVNVAVSPSTIIPTRTTSITFTASAVNGGTTPSYQWKLNGAVVATSANTYTNNLWREGDIVTCLLTSSVGCPYPSPVYSDQTIHLVPVSVITTPANCIGNTLTVASAPPPERIIWQLNGVPTDTTYASWNANATTVAGGNGLGSALNQLRSPAKVFVDNRNNVYVGDEFNHRVVKWAPGASVGVIVGGNGVQGSSASQVNFSWGVSPNGNGDVYIADENNSRVQKWSPPYTSGVTVAAGYGTGGAANQLQAPYGIFVDSIGNIYIADGTNNRVQKWAPGAATGMTVAGGNGAGNAVNQLNTPTDVVVDKTGNIYVNDQVNRRVQKWSQPYTTGVTVAGGNGTGAADNQIGNAEGIAVDGTGAIYIADAGNNRVARWLPGAATGATIAGGNGSGSGANQFNGVKTVALDTAGNLYVSDRNNHRIQKFATNTILTHATPSAGAYKALVTTFAGVSDTTGSVIINSSTVPAVSVTALPTGAICSGTNVTFTASPSNGGSGPVYQWRKNGNSVGTNSASYSDNTLANGDIITVRLTSNSPCRTVDTANSNAVTMVVNTVVNPSVTVAANPAGAICAGTSVTYTATVSNGGTTPAYQWRKNGVNVGTNITTYTDNALVNGDVISVRLTSNATCRSADTVNSSSTTVVVNPVLVPSVSITSSTGANICSGNSVTFTAAPVNGGTTPVYQWRKNGVNVTGVGNVYTDAGLANGDVISVRLTSNAICRTLDTTNSNTITMTVGTVPSQPSVITGLSKLCSGSVQAYSVSTVTGATSYTWTLPTGWSGTSTTNTITATATTTSSIATISVTANNGCGASTARTLADTVVNIPAQPGTITGNTPVCGSSSQTYSITAVNEATTYTWTVPAGWGTASSTTNSLTTTAAAASGSGTITVTASNFCGTSAVKSLAVTVINTPATPGAIIGNVSVCAGTAQPYSIAPVPDAATYTWTVPATNGWSSTASTTNNINTTAGTVTGPYTISVKAVNQCGTSALQNLTVNLSNIPAQPGTITGNTNICSGTNQPYNIAAVPEATSYTWTVPTTGGWTINGSNSAGFVNTTAGTTSGNITVTASNFCGTSAAKTLAVTVTNIPVTPGTITGNTNICGGTAQPYSITAVPGATSYNWTIPQNGWTATGATGTSVTTTTTGIASTAGTAGGTITVTASNFCGSSAAASLNVTVTNIPGQPGTISGLDSLCAGSGALYSIGQVNEATGYTWTLPTGTGFTGTAATNGLSFNLGTTGTTAAGIYNLTVKATNFCGTSPAASKTIVVTTPVVPAVSITGNTTSICSGQPVTFTATGTNTGTAPLYQWMKNGLPIGTASGTNTFTSTTLNNNDIITVQLHSTATCATLAWTTSNAIQINVTQTVTPGVSINSNYPANIICVNTPVTFMAAALTGGGPNPQFQWRKNGAVVGTNSINYTDATLNTGDSVSVIMTSSAACVTQPTKESNKIGNTVYTTLTPTVTVLVTPGTNITPGQSVTFTAQTTNVGNNPQYQWFKNGVAIGGATTATYTTTTLTDRDAISVQVAADLVCANPGVVTSALKIMTVQKTGVNGYGLAADISLYPNPTDGRFTVKIKGYPKDKLLKIELLNTIGQLVHTVEIRPDEAEWKQDIDLPASIASGAYMLRFVDDQDRMMAVKKLELIR